MSAPRLLAAAVAVLVAAAGGRAGAVPGAAPRERAGRAAAPTSLALAPEPPPPAARRPVPEEEPPAPRGARVAAVELALPPGDDAATARRLVAIAAGDVLSQAALRRTVLLLYQTGRYRNVIVRAAPAAPPPGESGPWVRLLVEALPVRTVERVVVAIDGPGADEKAVRDAAAIAVGGPFDEADLAAAEARVRAPLARRGRQRAEVSGETRGELAVVVELRVRPGAPVRVGAVRLSGDAGAAPSLASAPEDRPSLASAPEDRPSLASAPEDRPSLASAPQAGSAALAGVLRTRPGEVLDDDVLDADVRRLRSALYGAGYRRARVAAPAVRIADGTADVEIPVDAGPRVTFAVRGSEEVPAGVLRRELGFEEGQPVDVTAVAAAVERLVAFYRARGFAAVRVESQEVRRGRDLVVVFDVDEGRRYRIAQVTIEGAAYRSERWLRDRIVAVLDEDAPEPDASGDDRARALALSVPGVPRPRSVPAALLPHETWDAAAWDRAAERLVDDYRADGFLEAVYLGSSVVLDARGGTARVVLRVREGPRTTVESISYEGNAAVSLPELARLTRVAPGEPLAYERVEETRTAIQRAYLARGYLYARVETHGDVDRERHAAAIRFVVSEGPRVTLGRVVVTGNRRTRDAVVRKALSVKEGATYDPEAFSASQAALLRLGVFRSVSLRVQDAEVPQETKDVAVDLVESPRATLTQGVGFSIANGPRAFLEWAQPNLWGRALEFTAIGKVNYPLVVFRPDLAGRSPQQKLEGRADLGLRSQALGIGSYPTSVHTDAIGEIVHRKAYDMKRVSGAAGVDVARTTHVGLALQYEIEVDDIAKTEDASGFLTQADVERLRFDQGITTLHALRPAVTLDFRDNPVHPRHGWFATGAVEYAHSIGGPGDRVLLGILPGSDIHTNMVKLSGTASGYLGIGSGTVVALSVRGGRVYPLDPESRTGIPRRFFMGGANTMRGYAEDEMIPQDVRAVLAGQARACQASVTGIGCTQNGALIASGGHPVSEGGELYVLGKAEIRQQLRGSLEGGVFADLGNVWLDPQNFRLLDLRPNVGLGLRFVTPIGPAVLDLGFNVSPDHGINERTAALHFTVGLF